MTSSSSLRDKVHFILLKESAMQRKMRGSMFASSRDSDTGTALAGSLWYLNGTELDEMNQAGKGYRVKFHSAEQADCRLELNDFQDISELSPFQFELLLAVATCKERIEVYTANKGRLLSYTDQLFEAWSSSQSETILVDITDGVFYQERLTGELKYIGPVPGYTGYLFAVDLPKVYNGNLLTVADDCKLFPCRSGHTVLVAVNKIVPSQNIPARIQRKTNAIHFEEKWHSQKSQQPTGTNEEQVKLGDRVSWNSPLTKRREFGFVRWIGVLPEAFSNPELTIGIESDNPVGYGTGSHMGCELFNVAVDHALFLPSHSVTRVIDHYDDGLPVPVDSFFQYQPKEQQQKVGNSTTTSPAPSPKLAPSSIEDAKNVEDRLSKNANLELLHTPTSIAASELGTDLEIGSAVQVDIAGATSPQFGVVRWMGVLRDRDKPFVGVELDEETVAGTDGTFGRTRLFLCPAKHAIFVHLHRVTKDERFSESSHLLTRTTSQAFGSIDCPDVPGQVAPCFYDSRFTIDSVLGINKGIQGHQNSCYMDTMLFSMFAFSMAFDCLLFRPRCSEDIDLYEEVQSVLRDGIVNPLRSACYVRADKVMELRKLLSVCSSVDGLILQEKDPEEFINSLLEQTLKAERFLKLSSGNECYCYQLFMEKDEFLRLPTTQNLLAISFYQADLKFTEVPSCLILQMPRFGKDFKMYKRIVPSLRLDITDFLLHSPRPCFNCGQIAVIECKECFDGADVSEHADEHFFCQDCFLTNHKHPKRSGHNKLNKLEVDPAFLEYLKNGGVLDQNSLPRETMDLFAVVCIHTSHYVAFVKCGDELESPWVFFDSMADRIGLSHGYNVPKVELCPELPEFLKDENLPEILRLNDDRELSDHMRRLLCDGYICMYQCNSLRTYR